MGNEPSVLGRSPAHGCPHRCVAGRKGFPWYVAALPCLLVHSVGAGCIAVFHRATRWQMESGTDLETCLRREQRRPEPELPCYRKGHLPTSEDDPVLLCHLRRSGSESRLLDSQGRPLRGRRTHNVQLGSGSRVLPLPRWLQGDLAESVSSSLRPQRSVQKPYRVSSAGLIFFKKTSIQTRNC